MPKPRPIPDVPAAAFSAADAIAAGATRSQLRRRGVSTPRSGVRRVQVPVPTDEKPWERVRREHLEHIHDEAARMSDDTAISHISAGVHHGFPLRTRRVGEAVHVTAASDARRRRRKNTVVHPLPRDAPGFVLDGGLRVTDPVTTWCALASMLEVDELVAIGDFLVRRQHPLATLDELERAVGHHGRRWGVKKLRAALELVRPRTDSPRETELRLIVVRGGLPEPAVNVSVRGRGGRHVKLGDLVYEDYLVLLEYDGEQHRTDSRQYEKDAADLEELQAAGWRVVRIRDRQLRSHTGVITRVLDALRSHGYPGPSTVTGDFGRS